MNHIYVIESKCLGKSEWTPMRMTYVTEIEAVKKVHELEHDVPQAEWRVVKYRSEYTPIESEMMDEKRREMAREIREGERDTARERGYTEGLS